MSFNPSWSLKRVELLVQISVCTIPAALFLTFVVLSTTSIYKSWVLPTPSGWVVTPCLGVLLSLGVSQCPDCPTHLSGHSWLVTTSCLCHDGSPAGK